MSRSGYSDDYENEWRLILWRGAVNSAIKGRRGQAFLKELLVSLDTLERHRLIANELEHEGDVCALGAIGRARGINMGALDPEDIDTIAGIFGVARALACEIMCLNDEVFSGNWITPEERFQRIRSWAEEQIKS